MQADPNTVNLEGLYGFIFLGYDNAIDVINVANNQPGPIITMIVFGIFGLLPIMFLTYLALRRLCNCFCGRNYKNRKKTPLGRCGWACQAIAYLFIFVFIVSGMVLFGFGMTTLRPPLYQSGLRQNDNQITNLNSQGTTELNCYSENINSTFTNTSSINMENTIDNVDLWMNANGVGRLMDFDETSLDANYTDLGNQTIGLKSQLKAFQTDPDLNSNQLCAAEMNMLQSQFDLISVILEQLIEMMDPIILQTNQTVADTVIKRNMLLANLTSTADSLNSRILTASGKIDAVLNSTTNVALYDNGISHHLTDFIGIGASKFEWSSHYKVIIVFTYLLVYIPSTIMVFPLSVAFVVTSYKKIRPKSETLRIARVSNILMQIASYTVFVTVWYLFGMIIFLFWLSTAFSLSCPILYTYNPSFSIYDDWNRYLSFTTFNGSNLNISYSNNAIITFESDYTLSDYRRSLMYSQTVYESIRNINGMNLYDIMSVNETMDYIDISEAQTDSTDCLSNFDLSVYFDPVMAANFKVLAQLLQRQKDKLDPVNDLSSCKKTNDLLNFNKNFSIFYSNLSSISNTTNTLQYILQTVSIFTDTREDDIRENMISNNNDNYNNTVTNAIFNTVSDLMYGLSNKAWPSNAQRNVYTNSGAAICHGFRYSLNEVWASIFLIAIFMLPAGFLLRYTAGKMKQRKPIIAVSTVSEPIQPRQHKPDEDDDADSDVTSRSRENSMNQPGAAPAEIFTITPRTYPSVPGVSSPAYEETEPEEEKKTGQWG